MWNIVGLYFLFTIINVGVWWSGSISRIIYIVKFLDGNWRAVVLLQYMLLKLRVKQWWDCSCKALDVNVYEFRHVVRGKEVRALVKMNRLAPTLSVVNNEGKDISDKVIPYLRCSPASLKPIYVNESGLTICAE